MRLLFALWTEDTLAFSPTADEAETNNDQEFGWCTSIATEHITWSWQLTKFVGLEHKATDIMLTSTMFCVNSAQMWAPVSLHCHVESQNSVCVFIQQAQPSNQHFKTSPVRNRYTKSKQTQHWWKLPKLKIYETLFCYNLFVVK